jgi:uncharacterized protein YndB with AHSA1/START domain
MSDNEAAAAETTQTSTDERGEVTITRTLKAPRELVYRAFVDRDQLARFWGPAGTHSPSDRMVVEPWPGGRFETVMIADDGSGEYPTHAAFVELLEPERLVWTEVGSGLVSTTTFTDLGDGRTEMVIHQSNVPVAYLSEQAQAGFRTSLDRFDQYLAQITVRP